MTNEGSEPKKVEKRLEMEVEIDAPVAEVWKALTEGRGLQNWFPLEARVTPGAGGKIFLSWGPEFEIESEILAWEPEKRLQSQGMVLVDYTLESRGGKTVLRLVQSMFATGADWENEFYDSTSFGWGFILASLRWWLEVHPRENRVVAWPRVKTTMGREEVYRLLTEAGVFFKENAAERLHDGAPYSLHATTGEKFSGTVELIRPGRGFCVSVKELKDALLWFTIEGTAPNLEVQAWLSAFGLPEKDVQEFGERWEKKLKAVFTS
jgi:uncharacterized protein YndB with AHSA1/START domain